MAGLLFGLLFGSAIVSGGSDQQTRRANRGFAEARYKETGDPIQPVGIHYVYMPTGEKVIPERWEDGRTVWRGVNSNFFYDPTQIEIDKEVFRICNHKILLEKITGKRYVKLRMYTYNHRKVSARRKYINKEKYLEDFTFDNTIYEYNYKDKYGNNQIDSNDIIFDLETGEMYSQFLSICDYKNFILKTWDINSNIVKSKEALNSHYRINFIDAPFANGNVKEYECLYLEEVKFKSDEERDAFWDFVYSDEEPIKFPDKFLLDVFSLTKIRELVFGLSDQEAHDKYIRGFNKA